MTNVEKAKKVAPATKRESCFRARGEVIEVISGSDEGAEVGVELVESLSAIRARSGERSRAIIDRVSISNEK